MKIVFLLERPSQFDAPLFRIAGADVENRFEAWFTAGDAVSEAPDPELGRSVDWGFDRFAGYASRVLPPRGIRREIARLSRGAPIDLLIINGYTRRPYLAAAFAARSRRTPTALRIDSVRFPGERPPALLRRLLVRRLLAPLFDRFLVTGSLGRDHLLAMGLASDRIGRFTYAVDDGGFRAGAEAASGSRATTRSALGIPPDARVVLSLTKFARREAPWDLVAARGLLERRDLYWVLAGDGPMRGELEQAARTQGLDRLIFPGYVPYANLPGMYAAADLFVHPAREERWGVSVAEALACGLPVVTSDRVGASYDLIVPGENGDRYAFGNAEALALAIERSLALPSRSVSAATAPRLAEYGLEATWNGIVEVARKLRDGRNGSA
jgi:glycosyltransferase involved in cell wall biosynthesis